jgi:hypothetical protein
MVRDDFPRFHFRGHLPARAVTDMAEERDRSGQAEDKIASC